MSLLDSVKAIEKTGKASKSHVLWASNPDEWREAAEYFWERDPKEPLKGVSRYILSALHVILAAGINGEDDEFDRTVFNAWMDNGRLLEEFDSRHGSSYSLRSNNYMYSSSMELDIDSHAKSIPLVETTVAAFCIGVLPQHLRSMATRQGAYSKDFNPDVAACVIRLASPDVALFHVPLLMKAVNSRPGSLPDCDTPYKHIRQWANENGYDIKGPGRVPADVVKAYEEHQVHSSA